LGIQKQGKYTIKMNCQEGEVVDIIDLVQDFVQFLVCVTTVMNF